MRVNIHACVCVFVLKVLLTNGALGARVLLVADLRAALQPHRVIEHATMCWVDATVYTQRAANVPLAYVRVSEIGGLVIYSLWNPRYAFFIRDWFCYSATFFRN